MISQNRLNEMKKIAIVTHDLAMTALAVFVALELRFDEKRLADLLAQLPLILAVTVPCAALVYWASNLYKSKWRFASIPDLVNIVRAASLLAVGFLIVDYILLSPQFLGHLYFGKAFVAVYWGLQIFFLGGPRFVYRWWKDRGQKVAANREFPAETVLILGRSQETDPVLRAIQAGQVAGLRPVGLISPRVADLGLRIRGVQILGTYADLHSVVERLAVDGRTPRRMILCASALEAAAAPEAIYALAARYGIAVSQTRPLVGTEGPEAAPRLAPVAMEDLLLRPTVEIDRGRLERLVEGRVFAITGGGGSIGSEIARRLVLFGAKEVVIIENSEPALHAVIEALSLGAPRTRISGRLCDVRDRERVLAVIAESAPDMVIHAAALKHVNLLERDWVEGVKTNITGSINVADAALACGARAMVMVSTDKAVQPVSILGATKRLAEMYVQALEAELQAKDTDPGRSRLIAVRFGNVLGSNGSVVPKFREQIERGGPVTLTHPDMVRYFMTIPEASDLVLTASSHAIEDGRHETSVYVLNMGQPIRIMELAERMIRLAGHMPGEDIKIELTGLRPGERLREIVLGEDETTVDIGIPGVLSARPSFRSVGEVKGWMAALAEAAEREDWPMAASVFANALPDYPAGALAKATLRA
ncbi:O-antigen biosynthesis protein WbqV [Rhizobiales bacterium GAS113]|nr:O-antigen biosynthesis protein WbqV [Rhizobiales bacterium GAS113]SEC89969.1 O-antigen biosynthesis protein WbqV [Rhizobiales bacterium GAS188]